MSRLVLVFLVLCLSCAAEQTESPAKPRVKVVVLAKQFLAREIESFGSLSFLVKTDLSNLVEATVDQILFKEGAAVRRGQPLVRLKNPQLDIRKTQAEASLGIARSAVSVSEAQLWEGQLQVQARLLALDKAKLELDEKKLEWDEAERTYRNKQQLYDAGGTTQETLNSLKLNVSSQEASYQGLLKDWEAKRIGLRDEDLVSYGMAVPPGSAERLKSLVKLNTLTLIADLDSARSKADAAETEVKSAQMLIEGLTVLASMDGILGARYVEAGEHVQPGTKLVTLIDTSAVYATFPLQEDDAVAVGEGLAAEIRLDAFPGRTFSGRVDLVSPVIDPQTGAAVVKVRLGNPGLLFKPGMFARIKVKLGPPAAALMLPESAVARKTGTKARVYTVVNGRVRGKDIELGKNQGGSYTVVSGAQEQDLIIDSPSPLLKEGEEVDAR